MRKLKLTTEEFALLGQELTNSKSSRLKEIRNGMLILSVSAIGTVIILLFMENHPIANKLTAFAIFGTAFGLKKLLVVHKCIK